MQKTKQHQRITWGRPRSSGERSSGTSHRYESSAHPTPALLLLSERELQPEQLFPHFFSFFFFGLEEAKWQRGSANARFPKHLTRSGSSPPSRGKPSSLSQRLLHGSTGIFSCRQLKAAIWWQSPRLKFAGGGFSLLPPRRSRGSRSWRPQLPLSPSMSHFPWSPPALPPGSKSPPVPASSREQGTVGLWEALSAINTSPRR